MTTPMPAPDLVSGQHYKQLFSQAPAPIAIYKGRELRYEFVNEAYSKIFNGRDILNKTVREAFPELQGQGYYEILEGVFDTGIPYHANETPAQLDVNNDGRLITRYYNLVYTPFKNADGVIEGVMAFGHDVTDQVEARKKVEESEQKYHSLFNSMDQGFCIIEMLFDVANQPLDYRFLEINPVFEQQTGLKNAAGKTARELVPNLESHWFELYGKVALTGDATRFVQGSEAMGRWFEVYAFKIGGPESRKVAILFTDITRRRQSEEALRQSEERLQKALSIETVGVIYFDLEGKIHDANTAFHAMSGYALADFREGRVRWDELTPPEFIEATLKSRGEFLNTGQNTPYEKQYIRPDGSRWWGLFAGKRLSENECVEFVLDITDRKHTEAAIKDSEARFRVLANSLPLVVWTASPDGALTYISDQWETLYRNQIRKSLGNGWTSFVHPDDRAQAVAAWAYALQTGAVYETEFRIQTKRETYRWFLVRAVPVRSSDGRIVSWYGSNTDIDEQKRAEAVLEQRVKERTRELENINKELKRTNANLEEFAYAASHDMKEPIRKISFFSDKLKIRLGGRIGPEETHLFERMQEASKRMGTLIDDLLSYSQAIKGAAGQEDVDLNHTLQVVLEDLELEVQQKNATVQVDPLPVVTGSRRQLQQLFQNLISNALKYNKPNTAPHVHISSRKVRGEDTWADLPAEETNKLYHLIEVTDNGIGFEQADAERIFNVFTRLHGNAEYRGTGVGLSIVRKVARNHNGYAWAESRPGAGTTFKVLLPET